MATPIVISESQQRGNKCSLGDTEQDHMHVIGDELYKLFAADSRFIPFNVPKLTDGTDTSRLIKAVELSNQHINEYGGRGYTLALHSDGGYNGSGASAFYKTEGTPSQYVAESIYSALKEFTPWTDMRCFARPELYELRVAADQAVLIEISFHDQPEQAKWIHDNTKEIAYKIYQAFCWALGEEPLSWQPETPKIDKKAVLAALDVIRSFLDTLPG